jgi:hypothetical protein
MSFATKGEPPIQGSDLATGQNPQQVDAHTRLSPNKKMVDNMEKKQLESGIYED